VASPRQAGRTSEQMRSAPRGATYVWVNDELTYPRDLARFLRRTDLRIVSPLALTDGRLLGLHVDQLVVDHAAKLNLRPEEAAALRHLTARRAP